MPAEYESLNNALIACVKAAGGSSRVGPKLFPEKLADAAQRALLDHLNPERPAKLSPEQVLLIMRLARERGCHDGINYIADQLGYAEPTPIEPKDELADLIRQYIAKKDEGTKAESKIDTLLSQFVAKRPELRSA